MKQRPSITELHHSGKYALVESFSVHGKANFWAKEVGLPTFEDSRSFKKQLQSGFFWLILLTCLVIGCLIGYYISKSVEQITTIDYDSALKQLGFSVVFFLLFLAPIHESIHLLTYRLLGAPNVGFYKDFKKGLFFAYANRFVISLREHAWVAVMPFIVITSILFLLLVTIEKIQVFCLFSLLFHTLMCSKDFIVVRHFFRRRHQSFFLYDDYSQNRSYLFSTIYTR